MAKQATATQPVDSPIGENTTLTLTVKREDHEKEYQKVLSRFASQATIHGFRKGKAPKKLVEETVGGIKIIEQVLEDLVPELYTQEVKNQKLIPLVAPQIQAKSINPGEDWIVEAATATAPQVKLGDWKKILSQSKKNLPKKEKPEENDQELMTKQLSFVFGDLIKSINPKIPPLLLENETRRQLEEFARHLASHRIELNQYLQHAGKTMEQLQEEYMANALATLQLEFVLLELTQELKIEVTPAEIDTFVGETAKNMTDQQKQRMTVEAKAILVRRKTIDSIKAEIGISL